MIPDISRQLTETNFETQVKIRYLRVMVSVSIVIVWLAVIVDLVSDRYAAEGIVITAIAVHLMAIFLYFSVRQGVPQLAISITQVVLIAILAVQQRYEVIPLVASAVIVIGAFLLERIQFFLINGVTALVLIYHMIGYIREDNIDAVTYFGVSGVILVIVGVTSRYFADAIQSFASRNNRNNDLLRATAEVGQIVGKILDTKDLFQRSIELVRDRFAYYHVQIFMVDESRNYAQLVASTGEVGKRLLDRRHKLAVGSQSVIGRVTQAGEPIIARDTDRDPLHARNELLPNTRSELALPIFDGERIIGALDVQSTRSNAFQPSDIQALQIMANQIGIAIRNAQLFESQSASVQENKRLFFEAEANLREIQRLNRQLTEKSWRDFVESKGDSVTGLTVTADTAITEAPWTPSMLEASRRRRPIPNVAQGTLAVPIVLRGEVIGAIEIAATDNPNDEDMVEVVQSVAQRLAISLDNARLFEEAQQRSVQEQRLNEIAERYQSALSVDELLQITVTELNDVFGAERGKIRLGKPATQPTRGHGAEHNGDSIHE